MNIPCTMYTKLAWFAKESMIFSWNNSWCNYNVQTKQDGVKDGRILVHHKSWKSCHIRRGVHIIKRIDQGFYVVEVSKFAFTIDVLLTCQGIQM